MFMIPSPEAVKSFHKKIFTFYKERGRHDLPWRKTTNRYHILVSEIMLQQTQVDRVIPKYNAWITRFTTPSALAAAPLKDILDLWSGLGYNSRAKRLQDAAKRVVEQFAGSVPQSSEQLLTLPGIGPYTSRSVLIFADNQDLATVDTNIRRIFIDEFKLEESISDKELFELAELVLPKGKSCDWHNALMDYGATFLTARKTGIKSKSTRSTFSGSRRQIRGEIIRQLLEGDKTLTYLKKLSDTHDVLSILKDLEKEGLISSKKNKVSII